ncbi:hypothetical protein BDZ45DRAFT_342029 [Acephala macrosclerotiorum]|nr:hypothetical protein BDZ45DRAFT_342029 [Acephala macrosclerotiorum]
METNPRPRRQIPRRTLPSNGWNVINRIAATFTPPPRSVTQSSESSFRCQTPKRQNPASPASEGSRRTGEWLENMAKRRKAAQETVKRTSQSLEPTSDVTIPDKRTLRSIVPAIAHSDNGPAMAETRIIPNMITRSKKNLPVAHRNMETTTRQGLLHVVIGSTKVTDAELDHEPSLTISPLSRGVLLWSPGASDFSNDFNSCPTTVDDVPQDEGEVYDVERVLGEKVGPRIHNFLIQWVGYDEQSWIPAEDCFCDELIAAFRAVPRTKTMETAWIEQEIAIELSTRRKGDRQNQRPSKMPPPPVRRIRDLVTGRLHRLPSPVMTANPISGADREETFQLEEPALPRYARANTARFSARPATPVRVHRHQNERIREIVWKRSKAMSEAQIISWMVKPAGKENAENVFRGEGQALAGRNIKHKERELQIIREDRPRREALVPDTQHERAVVGKIPEQEHLASNGQQRDVNQQTLRDMGPPKETRKFTQENPNFLQGNWKKRVPVHIRFDENDVPNRQVRPQTPFAPRFNSRPEPPCDDVLRRARTQEKKSAGPSLMRHEFSNDMSHKHAQALINHTRASPERAFGFSLPSNAVLLSIERDEY